MSKLIITVFSAIIAAIVLAFAITLHSFRTQDTLDQFAVLMDAGSSHTGIFLYRWKPEQLKSTAIAEQDNSTNYVGAVASLPSKMEQIAKCEVSWGGIAELNVERVSDYFQLCIDKIQRKLMQQSSELSEQRLSGVTIETTNTTQEEKEQNAKSQGNNETNEVKVDRKPFVPVYLEATAGMRLLYLRNQSAVTNLYHNVEKYLNSTQHLTLAKVATIRGTEEGLYSWITVNYLTDTLINEHPTYGIIECGGASSQIAHEIDTDVARYAIEQGKLDKSDYHRLTLFNVPRNIRSTSYLCYGKDQFLLRVMMLIIQQKFQLDPSIQTRKSIKLQNPCGNEGISYIFFKEHFSSPCLRGSSSSNFSINLFANATEFFFEGTSQPDFCYQLITRIINATSCGEIYHHCVKSNRLGAKPRDFFAISAFYHAAVAAADVDADADANPSNFTGTISRELFVKNTDILCRKNSSELDPKSNKFIKTQCFSGLLVRGLIDRMYHIEDWSRIKFIKKLRGDSIGWTLGSMLFKSKYIDITYQYERQLDSTSFYWISSVSVVVIIASSCILVWILVGNKSEKN